MIQDIYPEIRNGTNFPSLSKGVIDKSCNPELDAIDNEMNSLELRLTGSCYSKKMLERYRELKKQREALLCLK